MNGGEVLMPDSAKEQKGLQPIVSVTANGCEGKVIVKAGDAVSFHVQVELPEGSGGKTTPPLLLLMRFMYLKNQAPISRLSAPLRTGTLGIHLRK